MPPPPDPSVVRIDGPWRHLEVHANGIRFHVVEAESPEASSTLVTERPLVILLHGFGSFWWSWRHQLRGLTGARVVAVDLRGYGGSDKPPRGYDGWTLAGDTAGLVRALGHKAATLVGHADGGLVCWATAVLHPRVVRAIGVVSSPHPVALRASALTRRDQGLALLPWMLRYQLPMWPERSLTRNNGDELEHLVRTRANGKWVASEDFSETISICGRRSKFPRRRIRRWSTSAGPCAASSAEKVVGSCGRCGVRSVCRYCTYAETPTRTSSPIRCTALSVTHHTVDTYPSPAQDISVTRRHPTRSMTNCRAS